ncbi:MAG: hypothetical protein SGI96_21175 [Bacteroidota bacterium]|nr:hypothetical protein [Bacteroidota bacterium]
MAIVRINPNARFKLVSSTDSAIDRDKCPKIKSEASGEQLKYSESLSLEDLVFFEDKKPTYFVCRNLTATEQVALYKNHQQFDVEKRKVVHNDMQTLLLKIFEACCKEVEDDGVKSAIGVDEVPYEVVQELGSSILVRMSLGDTEKKSSK